jgi:dihydroorotate dehydrogenase (NAD+) catalytic subunit
VVANTFTAMAIDVETRAFRLSRGRGGLSGPGIHPIVVRMVHDVWRGVARDAGVPIIGLGGVCNWRDAAEFILAGASAVGMGTALFIDPRAPLRVADGLADWVARQGCRSVSELVGAARASA